MGDHLTLIVHHYENNDRLVQAAHDKFALSAAHLGAGDPRDANNTRRINEVDEFVGLHGAPPAASTPTADDQAVSSLEREHLSSGDANDAEIAFRAS